MNCGLVPSSSNTAMYLPSKQPHLHLPATARGRFASAAAPWARRKAVPCRPSSSFRTRAAVEEGGFVGERRESFYELLGISEEVSFDDIKRAYKQLALKYHPDVSPPGRAEEHTRRFIEVQEAYETLSDPSLRALYDRDLARGLHLAFSTRRRFDEFMQIELPCTELYSYVCYGSGRKKRKHVRRVTELEERAQWRNRWQDQIVGLRRRSVSKDSEENLSWGARMRRQRSKSAAE